MLHRYKPCSGQLELDLGESKFPCATMGETLQVNLFAWETLSQLHTHCHRFSAVIPQPMAAVCVVSAPGCPGAEMGTGSLPSSHP